MAIMARIGFVILTLLTIGAYWLAWNNRASDKIISAILPIGLAAVLGVGASVLVFGGQPKVNSAFPTGFVVSRADGLPVYPYPERASLASVTLTDFQRLSPEVAGREPMQAQSASITTSYNDRS